MDAKTTIAQAEYLELKSPDIMSVISLLPLKAVYCLNNTLDLILI